MAELDLDTRPRAASSVTGENNRLPQARKRCTSPSLDMGEESRWQGFMLNGCR